MVGKERPDQRQKEADHFRLVGDSVNKQGNVLMKLVLDSHKVSKSLHLSTRVLNICIEVLTGSSHTFSPDGPNNSLLSQGCICENANGGEKQAFQGWGGGGVSACLGPVHGSTSSHILSTTSSNRRPPRFMQRDKKNLKLFSDGGWELGEILCQWLWWHSFNSDLSRKIPFGGSWPGAEFHGSNQRNHV